MTFPIKKGISSELFIERRVALYIQKWDQNFLAKYKMVKLLEPNPTRGGNEKP